MVYTEQEIHDNHRMRFYAEMKFNGYTVGKAYGANKKQCKSTAAKIALTIVAPKIYKEWKILFNKSTSSMSSGTSEASGNSKHASPRSDHSQTSNKKVNNQMEVC